MSEDEAPQTSIPDTWIGQFRHEVAGNPTAREAWKEIEQAGLESGAILLLWGYAGGAGSVIADMYGRTEEANRLMKATARAEEVAETSAPKRAQNPNLFRERASDKRDDALRAEWPMPNPAAGVRTVGDELALASELKGREIPLEAARKAMVKAAGERSPVNPFQFLFLLQGYAAKYGVTLGNKRLLALAGYALPERELDEGTLGRYLRDIPESVREGILRDSLPTLPPPEPHKNKR